MSLIKCENVSVAYSYEPVIENISITIEKGMYLCFFGENGCGKSTLMKSILGLIPLEKGKIIKDKSISCGYLPQQTIVQKDFPISVYEVVLSGFVKKKGLNPFYSKEMRKQALEKIKKFGIEKYKNTCYRDLSGGEQQRTLLARALCSTDDILFLDEPVTGLDPRATADMYKIIKELNNEGMTIVMVSHDISSAMRDATHILHISDHKQAFFGTCTDYENSEIGKHYLKGANF
jgi:zinc transport system ATP-binding protein